MKAIMVMYDSLIRNYLPNYGNTYVKMPNFQRLGQHCVTFEQNYAGSLPCMPARRELHTGRYCFMHRGWSPLEPFDDSMPEILRQNGIYTHLISDHYHYWEDGGATYHTRYSSWEGVRGQEGDRWVGDLVHPDEGTYLKESISSGMTDGKRQDWVNRLYIKEHDEYPQQVTFTKGLEFMERNKDKDNWFLQIETFDPHEPFFVPERFMDLYGEDEYRYDWPPYGVCHESKKIVDSIRRKYCALLSMCDECLGRVLDMMDANDMWKDTMLIVNTDHGYLLGEKEWWGKGAMPVYNEIAHIPLFIWDPRCGCHGQRRKSLTQTIDLAPTLLDYFNVPVPQDMQGKPLKGATASDEKLREYALFGFFGSHINITDGNYVYMRGPADLDNEPLSQYTLSPMDMAQRIPVGVLKNARLHKPFSFTKDCPVLQLPIQDFWNMVSPRYHFGHMLFDVVKDPCQLEPIRDKAKELELMEAMIGLMKENDAPIEQYQRLGLPANGADLEAVLTTDKETLEILLAVPKADYAWSRALKWQYWTLCHIGGQYVSQEEIDRRFLARAAKEQLSSRMLFELLKEIVPEDKYTMAAFSMDSMSHIK